MWRGREGGHGQERGEATGPAFETADSPKGADGVRELGGPRPRTRAVPKSRGTRRETLPAMTMEEVARVERVFARKLIKLGIREKTAWKTVYEGRRSLWDLSHRPAVERALAKAYFTQRGLTVLYDWWRAKWDRVVVPVQLEFGLDLG